jgi:cellulose synthase/poly-beta-1,6-N-acetylglucosamine synthase-like glycosyltransferase
MTELIRGVCSAVLTISLVYCLYQTWISLPMFGSVKPPHPSRADIHRFAILICARNEEKVIGKLIESLHKQNYPPDAFDVFVTADNCTDRTAQLARQSGAVVLERFDDAHMGKGYALNWTFSRLLKQYRGRYDACVLFDADNIADPNFLDAMNRQLNAGHRIAAGFRMGKNPSSSWVAGCSSLFWLMQTRFCFVPRARLHLPCFSVGGTGFMFELSVLGDRGWQTRSVCEDIEFTLNSIAEGHFVAFAPDALFYDEQPLTFSQSIRQRYRWSVGSFQLLSISVPRLFHALLHRQRGVFDALMYSFGSLITGVSGLCGTILLLFRFAEARDRSAFLLALAVSLACGYALTLLSGCLVLLLEKRTWPGVWKAILTYPIYVTSWGVINVVVLFYRDPSWKVIPHTQSVGIEEIETAKAP